MIDEYAVITQYCKCHAMPCHAVLFLERYFIHGLALGTWVNKVSVMCFQVGLFRYQDQGCLKSQSIFPSVLLAWYLHPHVHACVSVSVIQSVNINLLSLPLFLLFFLPSFISPFLSFSSSTLKQFVNMMLITFLFIYFFHL